MSKVLLLNFDYSPLNIIPLKRGIRLLIKGKAEIIKADENLIRSEKQSLKKPIVIRLLQYIKNRLFSFRISRNQIYNRDGHKCAYCGSKKNLTIDHILPRSRGGKNTWENLVTCCSPCNFKKGDRTPEEANMLMLIKPKRPNLLSEYIGQKFDFQNEFWATNLL